MEPLTAEQRRAAMEDYLRALEGDALEPTGGPLPFDALVGLDDAAWSPLGFHIVTDELRELTNGLNQWRGALRRWHAWNQVLSTRDEELSWAIQWEFVEPLVHQCLFNPSAVRDRFVGVATNALHQVQLSSVPAYEDRLLGDPSAPGERATYPSRRQKEGQLRRFTRRWPEGTAFMASLSALDDDTNRRATADFRNRASHGIAPRFSVGYTHTVSRSVTQAMRPQEQEDGRLLEEPIPGRLSVWYGYGGLAPLSLSDLWTTNCSQFRTAEACFAAYISLMNAAISTMPRARPHR